jgi:PEGA domain
MRTKNILPIALIARFLLAPVSIADDPPRIGELKVPVSFHSRPDNCDLYIDGKYVGTTDVAFRLTPGIHTIEMRREGWETWRRELTVFEDSPTRVAGLLKQVRAEK